MEAIIVIEALQPGEDTREALQQIADSAGAAKVEFGDDAGRLHVPHRHRRPLDATTAVIDALTTVAGNEWPSQYRVHPSSNRPAA